MATKSHFEVLDGLRGVAALLVLVFHISEILSKGVMADNWLPHGALAVDFFFALSGFVIAHAYDRRMAEGLGFGGFMLRRFVRLHPIVPLATLIGALAWVYAPFPHAAHVVDGRFWTAVVMGLFLLPYPTLADRAEDTHSLDGPTWTLFQEYIGSIAYGLVLHRLSPRVLAWLLVPAGGLLAWGAVAYGNLSVGWGWSHWWMAEARLAFPFIFGLLLRRILPSLTPLRMSFGGLAIVMTVAFAAGVPGGKPGWANGLLEFAYVALLFPLIILMGAHSRMSAGMRKVAKALGRLSYPLYIIHYPFIYWYWDMALDPHPHDLALWAPVLYIGSVALGWAALRLWDEPLRRWATARWIAKEN